MHFTLKPISKDSVENALGRADRYRLLNEPMEAESICRDVLAIDPENGRARLTLLLALTDQFDRRRGETAGQARELARALTDPYALHYYQGFVAERLGKASLNNSSPGGDQVACEWLIEAMEWYEKAEPLRPTGNDDAILRWNNCARIIMKYRLEPRQDEAPTLLE